MPGVGKRSESYSGTMYGTELNIAMIWIGYGYTCI